MPIKTILMVCSGKKKIHTKKETQFCQCASHFIAGDDRYLVQCRIFLRSVAMMLESTYSAVYNSFRAVIGVADHFSRMRTQLAQIFSALAVVRTLRWLLRKLLVLLRLREGGLQVRRVLHVEPLCVCVCVCVCAAHVSLMLLAQGGERVVCVCVCV